MNIKTMLESYNGLVPNKQYEQSVSFSTDATILTAMDRQFWCSSET